ncbi:MAG: PCMD domain-containing protein [Ignavibacteriae bacterium]|nr:PCMD domain-containing protein [Ignavibacteriota bacterium]
MCSKYILCAITVCFVTLFMSCSDNQPTEKNNTKDSTFTYTDRLAVPDFEHWKDIKAENGEFLYEDLIGNWWTTLNKLKLIAGPVTATKSTDSYSGDYSIRLETMSYGSFIITGLLMTGVFDPSMPSYVIQGKPFTVKPKKFSGYFKYFPANNDSCSIYIGIYKFNQTLMRRDTSG